MCEAQANPDKSGNMASLLRMISDEEVNQSISELEWMLGELHSLSDKIKGMYVLHYTTGTDKDNKKVLLQTEVVFGNGIIKFITQLDNKAAESLIDALQMSLAMVRSGDRLSKKEGNA